jgi:hypothetical protein
MKGTLGQRVERRDTKDRKPHTMQPSRLIPSLHSSILWLYHEARVARHEHEEDPGHVAWSSHSRQPIELLTPSSYIAQ